MSLPSSSPLSSRRRRAVGAALLVAAALALGGCQKAEPPAPKFNAIDITGAEYAREFTLPDPDGKLRSLTEFKGKAVVVFFGYTQCPDVCPTTLAELAEVKKTLGADGARVQVVFVTIDPERDTPALLKSYVENFGKDYVALRGDAAQTQAIAKEFKVLYVKVPGRAPGSYTMDHTAGSYVFDPEGRVRLFSRYGGGAQPMADDLKLLLAAR